MRPNRAIVIKAALSVINLYRFNHDGSNLFWTSSISILCLNYLLWQLSEKGRCSCQISLTLLSIM